MFASAKWLSVGRVVHKQTSKRVKYKLCSVLLMLECAETPTVTLKPKCSVTSRLIAKLLDNQA